MKIAFGMIIFESDFVLKECLESIYPYASQILISEGPVKYWQQQGYTTSTDNTNNILHNFPDPDNKIKIIHGQYNEKDDQCNAYIKHLNIDTEYLWNLDADEIYKKEDIEKIIKLLETNKYTSIGLKTCCFYGGFNHQLTGFEEKCDFLRIFKVIPGCTWKTHRPPTISYPTNITLNHLKGEDLYNTTNVLMYHYSYVFPKQVYKKINYYKAVVSKNYCIDNYFFNIYWPWVIGDNIIKTNIENQYLGVHEFIPNHRGECYTKLFTGQHPESIMNNMSKLLKEFNDQIEYIKGKLQ